MQRKGRRLDSSTTTIISDLELLTPSRRAPKSESQSESEHEYYTFSSDDTQDRSIDISKNNIPEGVPPRVIFSPEIEIPEGVQPQVILISENDKPEDIEAKLIHILQNNIPDDSPLYLTVKTVPSTEVASNIVNAISFGIIIAIMIGFIVFLLTKTFN
jgi:hypothetical protein